MLKVLASFLVVAVILCVAVLAVPSVTINPIEPQYIEMGMTGRIFLSVFLTSIIYEVFISLVAISTGSLLALIILFLIVWFLEEKPRDSLSRNVGATCGMVAGLVVTILTYAWGHQVIGFAPHVPLGWAVAMGSASRLFIILLA